MFSSSLVGEGVSLQEGGSLAFFFSYFFFQTHILSLCLLSRTAKRCIWSPNQESHTPPSNSQLSKRLSLLFLPKQAVSRAHWTDDPHLVGKKESLSHNTRKNGTSGIFHDAPLLQPFTFFVIHFLINIFSS